MDAHILTPNDALSKGVDSAITEVYEVLLDGVEQHTPVTRQRVRERLPLVGSASSDAVDYLIENGTIEDTDGVLTFTAQGQAIAEQRVRRHRLTECMLATIIGLDWWKVHDEAEQLTPSVSDALEARIVELLGDPGTCPHGNPIPGSLNRPSFDMAVPLTEAAIGPVVIARITETLEGDHEALQLLENGGLIPGRIAEVQDSQDGWVQVAGSVRDIAVPPHVAAHTFVFPR
jgi:DtxR family Mn-dependent transcriptional regulator